jgi:hypothetical protein
MHLDRGEGRVGGKGSKARSTPRGSGGAGGGGGGSRSGAQAVNLLGDPNSWHLSDTDYRIDLWVVCVCLSLSPLSLLSPFSLLSPVSLSCLLSLSSLLSSAVYPLL